MARCFLTGIHGFIGSWLAGYLDSRGHEVCGMARSASPAFEARYPRIRVTIADILEQEKVNNAVREARPDYVFHLAAQSSPQRSWEQPEETFSINVTGTLYLLEAVRKAGLSPAIEIFLSSSEYASGVSEIPIPESAPIDPSSPYGVSKIAAGQLAVLYGKRYGLKIVRVRPFFLIGPGKKDDVSSRFCRQIAAVEAGRQKAMKVGNLTVVRDFLDIRDGVEALWLAAERGQPGDVFNIASGKPLSVEKLLQLYLGHAKVKVPVESDPSLFRALDEPFKVGDVSKLHALGWQPKVKLEDTTRAILDFWREQTVKEQRV